MNTYIPSDSDVRPINSFTSSVILTNHFLGEQNHTPKSSLESQSVEVQDDSGNWMVALPFIKGRHRSVRIVVHDAIDFGKHLWTISFLTSDFK